MKLSGHFIPIIIVITSLIVNAGEQFIAKTSNADRLQTAPTTPLLEGTLKGADAGNHSQQRITIKIAQTESHAIYKSTDRGKSWQKTSNGLPSIHRINAMTVYGDTIIAATDGGIYRSIDNALSWESTFAGGRVISVAAHGKSIFAGVDNHGLSQSEDQGKSWNQLASLPAKKVRCLLSLGEHLYAGTDRHGVMLSPDSGSNWIRLSEHFPDTAQVFSLSNLNGRLFAGLYQNGLHSWKDGKTGWVRLGTVTPLALAVIDDTLVVGHNPGGLHWSDNLGQTWSKGHAKTEDFLEPTVEKSSLELDGNAPVWEMATGQGIVIAGAASGIFISEDRGQTWWRSWRGLPSNAPGVCFLITKKLVYAGVSLH